MMKGHPKDEPTVKTRARPAVPAVRTNIGRPPTALAERYVVDPFALTSEFDRYFDDMRRNMEALVFPVWNNLAPRPLPLLGEVAMPRADVRDEGEAYSAAIELPGFARQDLTLEVTPKRLEVVAKLERKDEKAAVDEDFLARERTYREMRRTFEFPEAILPEKVSAELNKGVLTVRAPKERPTPAESRVRVKVE
jgi:HSP20 family protein